MLITSSQAFAWESYDRVVAVVNSRSIIESEVNMKYAQLSRIKPVPAGRINFEKSRIIDGFIESHLVEETANEQSIIVSDGKITEYCANVMREYFRTRAKDPSEIEKLVKETDERLKQWLIRDREEVQTSDQDRAKDKTLSEFMDYISKTRHIDFDLFIDDLRSAMMREQVMSISIGVTPPTQKEAMEWYKANKSKLGLEMHVKHILIIPSADNLAEERKANEKAASILARLQKGESFEKLARDFSQDPGSAVAGGDLGWMMLSDMDPYFAGNIYRMTREGQLSSVFKSTFGYHIVKFIGKRDVTFESVENKIMMKLYNDRVGEQFVKWAGRKRQQSDVKIFMENYVEAK